MTWKGFSVSQLITTIAVAAHKLGSATHLADTLAALNAKISDATLDDSGDPRDPNAHAASHQDGAVDEIDVGGLAGELADPQPPKQHALGGSDHSASTLAQVNALVSDATLDDEGDPRPADQVVETGGPTTLDVGAVADGEYLKRSGSTLVGAAGGGVTPHALGGGDHTADSLANVNSKISDATLDDSSSSRPPTSHAGSHQDGGADEISLAGLSGETATPQPPKQHALGGSDHSASTIAQVNALVSDATLDDQDDPRPADQLIETGGPTTLDIASIPDGKFLRRVGSDVVGSDHFPPGYMDGGAISRNVTNPAYQLDIAACNCRNDANDGDIVYSGGTVDITASGANGLDTGSEAANTWYSVWVIWNPTTQAAAGLLSASMTSPTLPGGYTKKRRVGVIRNDASSNFLAFSQVIGEGRVREYHYDEVSEAALEVLTSGSATSWTDVDLSSLVPPVTELALLLAAYSCDNDPITSFLELRPNGSSISDPVHRVYNATDNASDPGATSDTFKMRTDSSRVIEYQVTAENAWIWVKGFIDVI